MALANDNGWPYMVYYRIARAPTSYLAGYSRQADGQPFVRQIDAHPVKHSPWVVDRRTGEVLDPPEVWLDRS